MVADIRDADDTGFSDPHADGMPEKKSIVTPCFDVTGKESKGLVFPITNKCGTLSNVSGMVSTVSKFY
ncbi:hypothetical protein T265_03307 [Opisthorchis viverrini]|uniref:Uncharacterized protein n=1 Tax=Opisthorchis viverrini TaxID=6198 RepID=A0A074ZWJ1_OPIVI|nr:hypothetical protein T265_03307 [Opisthorchis viverrini]KER30257.1 hypothetical protein T265_03307 [Opisthorchis viverrini]